MFILDRSLDFKSYFKLTCLEILSFLRPDFEAEIQEYAADKKHNQAGDRLYESQLMKC